MTINTKITDWITSQKPIGRRHPINLNNNITDISQKKICLKALTIKLSIAYLCDTNNETLKLPIPQTQRNSTLDAPKLLNDTQHSHSISQSCLLKGKKHKMLQSKKPIKQRSSRRKSAPLTSVNHRTPSPI